MYGLIVKLTIVPGKRDEMIRILWESAADMPGCLSYIVAKDSAVPGLESLVGREQLNLVIASGGKQVFSNHPPQPPSTKIIPQ